MIYSVDTLQVHPPKKPSVPKPATTVLVRRARLKQSSELNQSKGKRLARGSGFSFMLEMMS